MKIDFPREVSLDQLVRKNYRSVMDMHILYEKMLFQQEIARLKYVGAFALFALWCFFTGERGFSSDALLAIGIAGIAFLVVLTLDEVFVVVDSTRKRALYEAEGIAIEESYHSIVRSTYFQDVVSSKPLRDRLTLSLFLGSFFFLGISSVGVLAALGWQRNAHLGFLVAGFALIFLVGMVAFLVRRQSKIAEINCKIRDNLCN